MTTAQNVAKYFIKKRLDENPNTFDGNMKIQKLLFFSNMISLSETKNPLFKDEIYAFPYGCVVESIRTEYKRNYFKLLEDSQSFEEDFAEIDKEMIETTIAIFGHVPAKELSELNHLFKFWQNKVNKNDGDSKDLSKIIIQMEELISEIENISKLVNSFKEREVLNKEVINGIVFYFDFQMTDELLIKLEYISRTLDEDTYTIYLDSGELVIY